MSTRPTYKELECKVKVLGMKKDFFQEAISADSHPFYAIDSNYYKILRANAASIELYGDQFNQPICYSLTHKHSTPCIGAEYPSPLKIFKKSMKPMFKILLVEDNEMNLDMLTRRLQRKGYEVVIAVDGEGAVRMAQSQKPDLILMDIRLPVMDGWEAIRRIKIMPETQSIPIIALTAHAMAGDMEKCVEAGCDDYDTKPIDLPRLLEKMQALLNN
jgi:two-component system cell cycle response regulator DivK